MPGSESRSGEDLALAEQPAGFNQLERVLKQLPQAVVLVDRELVQRMDKRISVESHEGEGARFSVDLPLVRARTSRRTQAAVAETA